MSIIMIMVLRSSDMSVDSYHTTGGNIPEGSRLHTRRHENLKSRHVFILFWLVKCCIALENVFPHLGSELVSYHPNRTFTRYLLPNRKILISFIIHHSL